MPRVVITKGDQFRKELVFTNTDIISVGRSETNAIVLPDPSLKVSRHHTAIVRIAGEREQYFIRDLGSLHSTRVEGAVVRQQLLNNGSKIEIGDYELLFYTKGVVLSRQMEGDDLIAVRQKDFDRSKYIEKRTAEAATVLSHQGELPKEIQLIPEQKEIIEELLRKTREAPEVGDLFEKLMEPLLRVLQADRGFVGIFRTDNSNSYFGVGIHGFDPHRGEKIEIADEAFLKRLWQGEYVQDNTTLLVPLSLREEEVGFFCVDRKLPAVPFCLADIEFLSLLGRLATDRTRVRTECKSTDQEAAAPQEVLEWPRMLVGGSKKMREVYEKIREAASTDASVLIVGETGTGKGAVARAIHERSSRSSGSFVNVDLTNIPQSLAESELFGYRRGAHSEAKEDKKGRFELAHKGTIFLDEIGILQQELAPKLLKPIDEKEIVRLGDERPRNVDIRVIAASNKDLGQAVSQGAFPRDLYRRLRKIEIRLPSLRERQEDVPLLAHYFLDKYAKQYGKKTREISRTALQRLSEYHWPGNVGELEAYIEAAVSTDKEILFSWDFPGEIQNVEVTRKEEKGRPKSMDEVEKEHILEVLEFTQGNKTEAYKILGYRSRQTLLNKLREYGIARNFGQIE